MSGIGLSIFSTLSRKLDKSTLSNNANPFWICLPHFRIGLAGMTNGRNDNGQI